MLNLSLLLKFACVENRDEIAQKRRWNVETFPRRISVAKVFFMGQGGRRISDVVSLCVHTMLSCGTVGCRERWIGSRIESSRRTNHGLPWARVGHTVSW